MFKSIWNRWIKQYFYRRGRAAHHGRP